MHACCYKEKSLIKSHTKVLPQVEKEFFTGQLRFYAVFQSSLKVLPFNFERFVVLKLKAGLFEDSHIFLSYTLFFTSAVLCQCTGRIKWRPAPWYRWASLDKRPLPHSGWVGGKCNTGSIRAWPKMSTVQ